ncbi:MAG: Nitrogen fixation protein VnfA [Nitrosomonadaceae bacterium]|nr:Nitrogen fixation protein VnfA [Nitrosomonadaceae bacterium]
MPLTTQVKLLRVLQDGMFERVGGDRARLSSFRLICASNRDLKSMISAEKFRLDLYYRISGVSLRLPALRDRLEDVPALVENFLEAYARRHQIKAKRVSKNVYPFLKEQQWPGNVRQLLHEVEKAVIFSDSDELTIADFSSNLDKSSPGEISPFAAISGTIPDTVSTVEDRLIEEALIRHKGNKSRVALELGISRSYLYKKMREFNT